MKYALSRRQFLKLALLSPLVAGCRSSLLGSGEEPTPSLEPPTLRPPGGTSIPTVTLDLRYALENDAVDYGPSEGCQTVIAGRVTGPDGQGVPDVWVRVWTEDESGAALAVTDGVGGYQVIVAPSASEITYLIQLMNESGLTLWSDVVVAQAIPVCDLSQMTVNFVAAR